MSLATEISRLQADRNTIRAKLVELGMASNTANLTALAAAIEDIVNRGAVSASVQEGDTYTIPAGYHNGSGTVSGVSGGGNYSLQPKTVTPTKKQQNVTPDSGYYGLANVTVAAIPDVYQDVSTVTAEAGNVLTGKIFVAADGTVVTGSMVNNGAVAKTLDVTTITYTIPKGYHDGTGKVTLSLDTKTIVPSESEQIITPDAGKVLSKVVVEAIPGNYVVTSDATAIAGDLLTGKTAYAKGIKIQGLMANNGDVSGSFDGLTKTTYSVPKGYTTGGTISLTDDIEEALAKI